MKIELIALRPADLRDEVPQIRRGDIDVLRVRRRASRDRVDARFQPGLIGSRGMARIDGAC
jgi:hypothetical protein